MASPYPHDVVDRHGDGRPDRRAVRRHDLPLSGRWWAEGRWVHMIVETMSHRGASLSGLVPLRPGDRGILTLDALDLQIPCDVRWARDGLAGVAFTLTEAESARLQAHIESLVSKGRIHLPCLDPPAPAG